MSETLLNTGFLFPIFNHNDILFIEFLTDEINYMLIISIRNIDIEIVLEKKKLLNKDASSVIFCIIFEFLYFIKKYSSLLMENYNICIQKFVLFTIFTITYLI